MTMFLIDFFRNRKKNNILKCFINIGFYINVLENFFSVDTIVPVFVIYFHIKGIYLHITQSYNTAVYQFIYLFIYILKWAI